MRLLSSLPLVLSFYRQIIPNEKLEWHPCFSTFQCARLTVPMDYNRPLNESKDNPKVDIAMILLPGRNHTKTGEYSVSPVLINPGGPGGSGVQVVRIMGFGIQEAVDLEQDVIGFDPRGIGSTTPLADCYSFPLLDGAEPSKDDIARGFFHRFTHALGGLNIGIVSSSIHSFLMLDSRARAVTKLCKSKDDMHGQDSILRHVSTSSVARDMLSIVDAWDAWRDGLQKSGSGIQVEDQADAEMAEDTGLDTKGKLVYWGFSYGTLLGATFASMFPDRVGRVILDGVVDADYYVSPIWTESLLDADAVQESFFEYCHKAKEACAFYRTGDSAADLKARLAALGRRLEESPVTGINQLTKTPTIITNYMIKQAFFSTLYSPIQGFPFMAYIFDTLDRGDDELILTLFIQPTAADPNIFCGPLLFPGYNAQDALLAIMCGDKRYPVRPRPIAPISLPNITPSLVHGDVFPFISIKFYPSVPRGF
jgi:pimeloyl-ACP methyl ester carboxylesterase